jgi:hypothetical protein
MFQYSYLYITIILALFAHSGMTEILTIESSSGEGKYLRPDGMQESLVANKGLKEGANLIIGEKSFAILSFSGRSQIKMGSRSEIQLIHLQENSKIINFIQGELLIFFNGEQEGGKDLNIRIGDISLSTSKVQVFIEKQKQASNEALVVVREGTLKVSDLASHDQALAKAGESFLINAAGKFSTPAASQWVKTIAWQEKSQGMREAVMAVVSGSLPSPKLTAKSEAEGTPAKVEGRWQSYQQKTLRWKSETVERWHKVVVAWKTQDWEQYKNNLSWDKINFPLEKIKVMMNEYGGKYMPGVSQVEEAKQAVKGLEKRNQQIQRAANDNVD